MKTALILAILMVAATAPMGTASAIGNERGVYVVPAGATLPMVVAGVAPDVVDVLGDARKIGIDVELEPGLWLINVHCDSGEAAVPVCVGFVVDTTA